MKNIAIFASGSGTNAENIAKIFNEGSKLRVSLVLVNRKKAGVYARMEALGVKTEYVPNSVWDTDPQQIVNILKENDIDLVVLAGFMHYVAPEIVSAFRGRIINIHPSLLPKYGGIGMYGHYVHEAVIANRETESGVTVHYVTEECDGGEILLQRSVEITPEDTAETLEAKIHPIEYQLYPEAILLHFQRREQSGERSVESGEEGAEGALGAAAVPAAEEPEASLPLTPAQEWAKALGIENPVAPPPVPEAPSQSAAGTAAAPSAPSAPASSLADAAASSSPGPRPSSLSNDEPMPPTCLLWSVLATVCCCFVPGIVAIIYSAQVSKFYYAGDLEAANKASRMAQIWIIASFVLGIISATLWFPLMLATGL